MSELSPQERAIAESKGFNVSYLESHPGSKEREIVGRAVALQQYYARQGQMITAEEALEGGASLASRGEATRARNQLVGTPEYEYTRRIESEARRRGVSEEVISKAQPMLEREAMVNIAGREAREQAVFEAQQRAERAPQASQTVRVGSGFEPREVSVERGEDPATLRSNIAAYVDVARGAARFVPVGSQRAVSGGGAAVVTPPAFVDEFGQGVSYDPGMQRDSFGQGMTVMPGLKEAKTSGFVQGLFTTTEGPATTGTVFGAPVGRRASRFESSLSVYEPKLRAFESDVTAFEGDVSAYESDVASFEAAGAPAGPAYEALQKRYTRLSERGSALEARYTGLSAESRGLGRESFIIGAEVAGFEAGSRLRASRVAFPETELSPARTVQFDSPESARASAALYGVTFERYRRAREGALTPASSWYEKNVLSAAPDNAGVVEEFARGALELPKTMIIQPAESFIIGGGSAVEDVTRDVASQLGVRAVLTGEKIKPVTQGYRELYYPQQFTGSLVYAAALVSPIAISRVSSFLVGVAPGLGAPAARYGFGAVIGGGVTGATELKSFLSGEITPTTYAARVLGGAAVGATVGGLTTVKYEKVEYPTSEGDLKTVYRSLYSKASGRPIQYFGVSEKGRFYLGESYPATSAELPSVSIRNLQSFYQAGGAAEGFVTKGPISQRVLGSESMLKSLGLSSSEIAKQQGALSVLKVTEFQSSPAVKKIFPRQSRLGPEATEAVLGKLKTARGGFWSDEGTNFMGLRGDDALRGVEISKIGGSFAAQTQLPGARPAADIDIQLGSRVSQQQAESTARSLANTLKQYGFDTNVEGSLVRARGSEGGWFNALDIHYSGQQQAGYTTLSTGGEQALGRSLNQPTLKVEGLPAQRLSEQGVRKAAASLQLFKERGFEPRPYRAKDVTDFYNIQEFLVGAAEQQGADVSSARAGLEAFGSSRFRALGGRTPVQASAGQAPVINVDLTPLSITPASASASFAGASASVGLLLPPASFASASFKAPSRASASSLTSFKSPSPRSSASLPSLPSFGSVLPSSSVTSAPSPRSVSSAGSFGSLASTPSASSLPSFGSVSSVPSLTSAPSPRASAPSPISYSSPFSSVPSVPSPVPDVFGSPSPVPPVPPVAFTTMGFFGFKPRKPRKRTKRKYKYQPDITSVLTGRRAKRAPKGAFDTELFSGVELRPII